MPEAGSPTDRDEIERRTRRLALRCIRVAEALPRRRLASRPIGQQLIRCATSVAANYRAARRARSRAEFSSKISIVVEEADETAMWLELVAEAGLIDADDLAPLLDEARSLTRLFAKTRRTTQQGKD